MDLELTVTLAVLALIDSLSFGTLLIPLFFLLAPSGPRPGRMLAYLMVIAGFYFAVGLALLAGASAVVDRFGALVDSPAIGGLQLAVGAGLLVWSFFIGRGEDRDPGGGRLVRWRDRAMGEKGSIAPLLALALGAGLVEVATMLPYLGAIGLLSTADLTVPTTTTVLLAYCLVMVTPALVLLAARLAMRRLVEPVLRRIADWMRRNAAENTAWIVGIVGFLLARDAAARLGLLSLLDRL